MKKILHFLTIGIILSLVNGCEKPNDEPKLPLLPIIKVSADPATIEYGSSSIINITTTNTDSIVSDLPGLTGVSGSFPTPKLTETTTFHFVAHSGKGLTDTANVTIIVKELPPPPTVSVSANPYTVIRGKTTTISWNVTGEVDSVKSDLSGISTKSGSITLTPQESRLITLTAYGKGGITSDTAMVTVIDPPPPTMEELLCNFGPWNKIKLEFQQALAGSPWIEYAIWECSKDNLYYFYLTPTKKMVSDKGVITCSSDETRIREGPWSLSGNILDTGGLTEIITLNKDTLVWVYGTGEKVRETFIHP